MIRSRETFQRDIGKSMQQADITITFVTPVKCLYQKIERIGAVLHRDLDKHATTTTHTAPPAQCQRRRDDWWMCLARMAAILFTPGLKDHGNEMESRWYIKAIT